MKIEYDFNTESQRYEFVYTNGEKAAAAYLDYAYTEPFKVNLLVNWFNQILRTIDEDN